MDAANRFLQTRFIAEHNRRFRAAPAEPESAFIPYTGRDLADILCIQEERSVGNDNTVRYLNRVLQIPAERCLARFDADGAPIRAKRAAPARGAAAMPGRDEGMVPRDRTKGYLRSADPAPAAANQHRQRAVN
jgi:hypothetical protein